MVVLFAGSHSAQASAGVPEKGGGGGQSTLNVRWLGAGRGAASNGPRTATATSSSSSSTQTTTTKMPSSSSTRYINKEGNAMSWTEELYEAETWSEGMRALFRVVPKWVPAAGLLSALALYYAAFRVRLFVAQWRIAERRKAERKYALLDNLRGVQMRAAAGAAEALADDDNDDEEEDDDDETAVSMRDIDEFRSSLGIRLPRDEDLLGIVECMLLIDPIPDGWVLYRTTAGIIRFMNLNTQELFFFHPNKRREKAYIEAELKKRNRQAIENKYTFFYEDDNNALLNAAHALPTTAGSSSNSNRNSTGGGGSKAAAHSANTRDGGKAATGAAATGNACDQDASAGGNSPSSSELIGSPSPRDFGSDAASDAPTMDETQSSAFKRIFHYFVEKEQRRIEQEVARARNAREDSMGSAASNAAGMNNNNNGAGNNNAGNATANALPPTGATHGNATTSGTTPPRAPMLNLAGANSAARAGRAGSMDMQGTPRRQPASVTCRVVPSSTIHGSRGTSTANAAAM